MAPVRPEKTTPIPKTPENVQQEMLGHEIRRL